MATSYIPDGTYAVCTFQISPNPQKLIASRGVISLLHKDDKPLLNTEDKNLEAPFVCRAPINMAASFIAFGAGIIVAVVVFSTPIGWVVAGCLAIAVVAGGYYTAKVITHTCTAPLKAGQWALPHPNVKIDTFNAITQVSILTCGSGGILKPFLSHSVANAAARKIMWNNIGETIVTATISFFAGSFLPAAIGGINSVRTFTSFISFNLAGLGITWTLQYKQKAYMRNDPNLKNNEVYDQMNEEVDKNALSVSMDDPSDPNDLASVILFQTAVKEGRIALTNHNLNELIGKYSRMTTAQLKKNPEFKRFLKEVRAGTYGNDLKDSMKNVHNRVKPTSSTVKKGMNYTYSKASNSLQSTLKASGAGALFFLPFLATYFSENARKELAIGAVKDMTTGTVLASKPL